MGNTFEFMLFLKFQDVAYQFYVSLYETKELLMKSKSKPMPGKSGKGKGGKRGC